MPHTEEACAWSGASDDHHPPAPEAAHQSVVRRRPDRQGMLPLGQDRPWDTGAGAGHVSLASAIRKQGVGIRGTWETEDA